MGWNRQADRPVWYPSWDLELLHTTQGKGNLFSTVATVVQMALPKVAPLWAVESGLPEPRMGVRIWPKGWILAPPPGPSHPWARLLSTSSLPRPSPLSVKPPAAVPESLCQPKKANLTFGPRQWASKANACPREKVGQRKVGERLLKASFRLLVVKEFVFFLLSLLPLPPPPLFLQSPFVHCSSPKLEQTEKFKVSEPALKLRVL